MTSTLQVLMTLDELLALPLPQRIAWLHSTEGPRGKLSHDRFAAALGAPNRQTIIGWENGAEPSQKYAEKLAAFSGFPAWAFRRRESEEPAWESFARRLQSLEAYVGGLATKEELHQTSETLREAIDSAASRDTRRTARRKAVEG